MSSRYINYGTSVLKWPRDDSFVEIKKSRIKGAGDGLFSTQRFKRGDCLLGFQNPHMLSENDTIEMEERLEYFDSTAIWNSSPLSDCKYEPPWFDYMFHTSRGKIWVDLSADENIWYKFNHSAKPNVEATLGTKGPLFIAKRIIGQDEELTIKYQNAKFLKVKQVLSPPTSEEWECWEKCNKWIKAYYM